MTLFLIIAAIIYVISSNFFEPKKTIPILRWKIELMRSSNGFGFGLRGGKDHNLPFYVLRLASNGPAAKSGEMRIGDIVEEINQTRTGNIEKWNLEPLYRHYQRKL